MLGNAGYGTDYTLDGTAGQIVIPPGNTSASIPLHALTGAFHKKAVKVKLKLSNGIGYKIPRKAGKAALIKIKGR